MSTELRRPTQTIANERTKLSAGALNSLAVGSIAAGFITPLAAASFGLDSIAARGPLVAILSALAWLLIGSTLHFLARQILGGLQE